jgi:Phosphodiester glycosidase
MLIQKPAPWPRWAKLITIALSLCILSLIAGLATLIFWPQVAAQNIDRLRNLIGDAPVAQLETTILEIQDHTQQLGYQVGLVQPAAPWADTVSDAALPNLLPTAISGGARQAVSPKPSGALSSSNAPAWRPTALAPLGTLAGEGQWVPYLSTASNQAVAFRTFLQPDPQRPYSVAAIVAFDLQATRLHFVLGSQEPVSFTTQGNDPTVRTGTIPVIDLQPGLVLAAFNGGFKARHGYYGAMANGLTALPPIAGLGTVAIYKDGRVQIGEWGKDIKDSPDLVAWRQNGELLIHNEQVNPDTAQTTTDWGLTVRGAAVTWRSALGLSADGRTLYYVAGPQLDVATVTHVMAQLGVVQALQLDINSFWVNFAALHSQGSTLTADPLLKGMTQSADRYLKSNPRDFFYLTAINK